MSYKPFGKGKRWKRVPRGLVIVPVTKTKGILGRKLVDRVEAIDFVLWKEGRKA